MILYHGSNVSFDEIDLNKSKTNKDFGKGFYLSDNYEQAEEMARFKVVTLGGVVTVSKYEVHDSILQDETLKIKIFEDYSKEWAEFVFANRKNGSETPVHDYDVVYGPIANDKVGLQIRKLQDGSINLDEFLHRLKYMKGITFQYFLGTQKAINKLRRL
ncbi:MAG: DUF3990 domain-containing protein [Bacteroidaceae bacterium]|nr:DUF3990 domain-containing protein [Bacteroidaceae bacterium]